MSSFDHSRAIFAETTSSFALRVRLDSLPTTAFFTYCCVIVDPPPAPSRPRIWPTAARAYPVTENPGFE